MTICGLGQTALNLGVMCVYVFWVYYCHTASIPGNWIIIDRLRIQNKVVTKIV